MKMRIAIIAAGALLAALPAGAGAAVTGLTFGSTLSGPPTNFEPPATCDPSQTNDQDFGPCTRVAIGYAAGGAVKGRAAAPITGTIRRIRIRAGTPGSIRVTLVRVRNLDREGGRAEGRAVSRGRLLRVMGPQAIKPPIETFLVNMKVHKGDFLALEGRSTSALSCQGGDSEQLLYQPPLAAFGGWDTSETFDDCTLLVQATVYRPKRARRG